MSRTITAFFDNRSEAEEAKQRLQSSSIDADRIRIVDQNSSASQSSAASGSGENKGFFASLTDMFMPDEDAYAYQEGINRGGVLLTAEVDEHEADRAIQLLEDSNSVDFDSREQEWRSSGWAGYQGGGMMGGTLGSSSSELNTGTVNSAVSSGQTASTNATGETGRVVDEERIPVLEEELRVGKREVSRGGARVRSYVREVPVHEQVRLHEEHVSVERRPVSATIASGDLNDMFEDRTIEMTETAEEAVVAKEARVVEEVVVRKTGEGRVQQIDDTVRRTEVDVAQGTTGSDQRSAFGGFEADRSGTSQGGLTGDRDGDGMPNALDTTDRNRR